MIEPEPGTEGELKPVSALEALFDRAVALAVGGDSAGAAAAFGEVIAQAEAGANTAKLLALAYFNRGAARHQIADLPGALEDFSAAVRLYTDSELESSSSNIADALYQRGRVRQEQGDAPGALADYDAATTHDAQNPWYFFSHGIAHYEQGALDAALSDYNEAIRLNPTFAEAYALRGNLLGEVGQHQQAISDLLMVVAIKPDHPELALIQERLFQLALSMGGPLPPGEDGANTNGNQTD